MDLTSRYLDDRWLSYLIQKNEAVTKEETLVQTEECLRFLSLIHLAHGGIPVSKQVDVIWHLLILETQAYERLCATLPAGRFIHHTSDEFSSLNEEPKAEAKRSLEWLLSYVHNFGDFTEASVPYWPYVKTLLSQLSWPLHELNAQLRLLK